jgi:hypothetical protein
MFFFCVNANLHANKKNRIRNRRVAREYGFKLVPCFFGANLLYGTATLTLPYAGATRIRFEGLPANSSGSQSAFGRHP